MRQCQRWHFYPFIKIFFSSYVCSLNDFSSFHRSETCLSTNNHTIPHFDALRYIAVENIVRKEKLLVKSNFSFSHNVFYPIWHLFFILNAL